MPHSIEIFQQKNDPCGGKVCKHRATLTNLSWNVSKSWPKKVAFFKNYASVAIQSDNGTFMHVK